MRVIHKADRDAVEDWIKGCGDIKQGAEVLNTLAGMKRGEAFVWSPEINFGPKRLAFPLFETFDSFAPARLQQKVKEHGWASVDLAEVKQKLASVIEKAKQADPLELQKVIAGLRKEIVELKKNVAPREQDTKRIEQLTEQLKAKPAGVGKTVEKKIAIAGDITRLEKLVPGFAKEFSRAEKAWQALSTATAEAIAKIERVTREARELNAAHVTAPVPTTWAERRESVQPKSVVKRLEVQKPKGNGSGGGEISNPMQNILNELAELEAVGIAPADKVQLGLFCGYTNPRSGGFTGPMGRLSELGLIQYPRTGFVSLTDTGKAQAVFSGNVQTVEDLQERIIAKVGGPRGRILKELIALYPKWADKEELGQKLGYTNPRSGGFTGPLGSLSKLGLIQYPQAGQVTASDLLFPQLQ